VTTILYDDDIRSRLNARDAVRWMGEAIDARHRGDLVAPPRAHADLGDGRIVFTTGQLRGSWFGCRSYDTFPAQPGSQVVVVHDEHSGEVRAIAIGNELGPRRVGAIGAVAAEAPAPSTATIAAIIGTGTQALTQLWALSAVRNLSEVRVFSRTPARREAFAELAQRLTAVACDPAPTARTAIDGAQIVVLATSSPTPVIDAGWLEPGALVTTLGPKQRGRAEFGLDLPAIAAVIATDCVAQLDAYDPPNALVGTPHHERIVSLGALRAGDVAQPQPGRVSLFCSVGLAGTEAFLLDRLATFING
jgi:ornithine cyclodeaminase/alanine dehydrogenase-like protein (mu-crystallin family)